MAEAKKTRTPRKTRPLTDKNVIYSETKLTEMLDTAEERMVKQGKPLYQRQGRIVHIVRNDPVTDEMVDPTARDEDTEPRSKVKVMREPGTIGIRDMTNQYLREHIVGCAEWLKLNKDNILVPYAPTVQFAQQFAGRGEWKHVRVLTGIAECPIIREDGSIVDRDGYDVQTGIYLDTNGVKFPKVKAFPTREDALKAIEDLKDLLSEFPFVPDEGDDIRGPSASRSVGLSMIITSVTRKAMDNAPLHAADAPTPGTGKTALCDTAAYIGTGHHATTMNQGATVEEFDKRVYSILLAGDGFVMVDNIDRPLESGEFCTVLTSPEWTSRPLGSSVTVTVSTKTLWTANGNNLKLKGDLTDRTISARMDARMEVPGQRKFSRDLDAHLREHRPRYVADVLTIMRAFILAGRPGAAALTPSRARDWDRWTRGALVWLGEPDPMKTRDAIVSVDPLTEAHNGVLKAWEQCIGVGKKVSSGDIMKAISVGDDEFAGADTEEQGERMVVDKHAAIRLRDALQAMFPPRAVMTAIGIGHKLGAVNGRIVDGLRIVVTHSPKGNAYALQREAADEMDDF